MAPGVPRVSRSQAQLGDVHPPELGANPAGVLARVRPKCGPVSATCGRMQPNLGRMSPISKRMRPNLAGSCAKLQAGVAPSPAKKRPSLAGSWSNLAEQRPRPAESGRSRAKRAPKCSQLRPTSSNLAQVRPIDPGSTDLGQSSTIFGPGPLKFGPSSTNAPGIGQNWPMSTNLAGIGPSPTRRRPNSGKSGRHWSTFARKWANSTLKRLNLAQLRPELAQARPNLDPSSCRSHATRDNFCSKLCGLQVLVKYMASEASSTVKNTYWGGGIVHDPGKSLQTGRWAFFLATKATCGALAISGGGLFGPSFWPFPKFAGHVLPCVPVTLWRLKLAITAPPICSIHPNRYRQQSADCQGLATATRKVRARRFGGHSKAGFVGADALARA